MTVVAGWFLGTKFDTVPDKEQLPDHAFQQIVLNCAMNSKVCLMTLAASLPDLANVFDRIFLGHDHAAAHGCALLNKGILLSIISHSNSNELLALVHRLF